MLNNYNFCEDLEIELSVYCNASCPLCYRNYKSFKNHYPKPFFRDYDNLIEQLDNFTNVKYIRIVGSVSEPTLHPRFLDLIDYCHKRNWLIEICTNGDTRDIDFWRELGNKLSSKDKIYFTICGSTQELHEKYRKGTNLNNILANASVLREAGKKNDYAQCIRFNYNDNDFNSEKFKELVKDFSHVYWTRTFYLKDQSNYNKKFNSEDFKPIKELKPKYDKILEFANKKPTGIQRNCKAYNLRINQIDIYGNLYPCYLFMEGMKGRKWDQDWGKILAGDYEVCKFCNKYLVEYQNKNNLEDII